MADTGQALNAIVAKVVEIDGLIADIAVSAEGAGHGLSQVNTAVNQMDQVTQQNAAMVAEVAAAAGGLKDEAVDLAGLVDHFRTEPGRVGGPDTGSNPAARVEAAVGPAVRTRRAI